MRRFALPLFALLAVAPQVDAAVIYEYRAEASAAGLALTVDFVYTAGGFITADTVVPAANLTSCSIGGTFFPGATCNDVNFDPTPSIGNFFVNVRFTPPGEPAETLQAGFFEGSLAAVSDADGYNTNLANGNARLRVTQVQDPPPVPEPTTWLLLATSVGGLFARRRLRS